MTYESVVSGLINRMSRQQMVPGGFLNGFVDERFAEAPFCAGGEANST